MLVDDLCREPVVGTVHVSLLQHSGSDHYHQPSDLCNLACAPEKPHFVHMLHITVSFNKVDKRLNNLGYSAENACNYA
jgi:hypothetical protein